MAINNPYVPGDPFSYDLKWLVKKIKEHSEILNTLDAKIAAAIQAAIENIELLGPLYFETAADLIASDAKDGTLAYIEGFYASQDGGAMLYYVTTDYNDVLAADFYITLNGANRWAIPIVVTPYVIPEMFGAVGDGTTDDTKAFKAMASISADLGLDVRTDNKTYLIEDTVTFDGTDVDSFILNGTVKFGMSDRVGVKFTGCDSAKIRIAVSGQTYNGGYSTVPTDFNIPMLPFVGVLFENTVKSEIYVSAENCNVGARFIGKDNKGCVFNTVTLGMMVNNANNLELVSDTGGWINDNLFLNGNFSCWSDNTFKSYHVDIRQRSVDGVNAANNNVFIKPSFEGGGMPIYLDFASFNTFQNIRCENGTTYYAKVVDGRDNVFDGGYGISVPAVKPGGKSAQQIVKNIRTTQLGRLILLNKWQFDADENYMVKGASTTYARVIKGLDTFPQGNGTPENLYPNIAASNSPETAGLSVGNALCAGFYVDVTNISTLYVRFTNADGANTGRFALRFFDSSWTTIEPTIGSGVSTDSNFSFYYQNSHLVTGASTYGSAFMPVYLNDATIKYVFVAAQYYGSLATVEAYTTIESAGGNPSGLTSTRQPKIGDVAIPANGLKVNCKIGRVVPNAPAAANGDGSYNFAYVCTDPATYAFSALKSGV